MQSREVSSRNLKTGAGLVTGTTFWTNPARSGCPGSDEERRIVLRTMAHLSRDKTAPKMGHPVVVVLLDVATQPSRNPDFGECTQQTKPTPSRLHSHTKSNRKGSGSKTLTHLGG